MIISSTNWELGVQSYLNLCNITDATPRKQIRDFAAGVNDLGLWSNMVCWPLRSTQNAGTGTTAYSLGGLGTFDGTLVDGPVWGPDGITTIYDRDAFGQVSYDRVVSGLFFQQSIRSALSVSKPVYSGLQGGRFFGPATGPCFDGYATGGFFRALFGGGSVTFGSGERVQDRWHIAGHGAGGNNWFAANGSYTQSGTTAGSAQTAGFAPVGTSTNDSGGSQVATYAFTIAFDGLQMTSALYASFRSLYKSTLGTGLGLP